ncbi:MAG: ribosome maturation factor RimM [Thalassotalea sp.]
MTDVKELTLGKVGAVYGIKGWLKIHSFTDIPDAIFDYAPWSIKLGENTQSLTVTDWRKHNNGLIAKVAGIEDRDQAQRLVGFEISVSSEDLPALPEGDFYWKDLIGMQVVTSNGYSLGVVSDLMETGANDVLVVKANFNDGFGKKERLIPYLMDQVVIAVSPENKQIEVDWDPGF